VRTTTPTGGEVVTSLITSEGLIGVGERPDSGWGNAPTMLLVVVVADTVRPDGTATVLLDRAWSARAQSGRRVSRAG
jgi:hypothetical protein